MGKWTESDSVAEEGVSSSEVSGPSTKPVKMLEIPDISKRKMAPVVAKRGGLAEPMRVEKPLLAFSKAFLGKYLSPHFHQWLCILQSHFFISLLPHFL